MSDDAYPRVLSTSAVAHLLFAFALLVTPLRTDRLGQDLFERPGRFERIVVRAPDTPRPEARFELKAAATPAPPEEVAGRFGEKTVDTERTPLEDAALDLRRREADLAAVSRTGLLAVLDRADTRVLSPGGAAGVAEALRGLETGEADGPVRGTGGWTSRGLGPGSGGDPVGGPGRLATAGAGDATRVGLEGRRRQPAEVERVEEVVLGGLDRAVVASIVRRHQSEIRYCYERDLQRDPSLHGRVAVHFLIDGTGAVAHAEIAETTLRHARVEACILDRVRRWRFPEPRGGGSVRVTYPWILSPRG